MQNKRFNLTSIISFHIVECSNNSICFIDETLSVLQLWVRERPQSNGNERVRHIYQNCRTYFLKSYQISRRREGVLPFCSDGVDVLCRPSRLGLTIQCFHRTYALFYTQSRRKTALSEHVKHPALLNSFSSGKVFFNANKMKYLLENFSRDDKIHKRKHDQ